MGGAEHKTSLSAFLKLGNGEEQSCPWDRRSQAPHKWELALLFGFHSTFPRAALL